MSDLLGLCDNAKELTDDFCQNGASGYYCEPVSGLTYDVKCTYNGLSKSETIFCASADTKFSLCPTGYYCPDPFTKVRCPEGSYCYLGEIDTTDCPFGKGPCPDDTTQYPDSAALFFLLLCLFLAYVVLHKYGSGKILFNKERNISDLTAREAKFKILGKRAITWCNATNHWFSSADHDIEEYKAAVLYLANARIAQAVAKDVTSRPQSTQHVQRASTAKRTISPALKKKWLKFIRSSTFRRHVALCKQRQSTLINKVTGTFSFRAVKVPLDISFDKLSLHLKSNNARILNDIFGSFKAFSITALMGSSGAG